MAKISVIPQNPGKLLVSPLNVESSHLTVFTTGWDFAPPPISAPPAYGQLYPSALVSPYTHSQSPATYNSGQDIPNPYACGTRTHSARLNYDHYDPVPRPYRTSQDLCASDTGPHQAYHGPHAPGPAQYSAMIATNSQYQAALGRPHYQQWYPSLPFLVAVSN